MAKRNIAGVVEDIRKSLRDGSMIAFVGAGTSMGPPAYVPGWRQCFLQLCQSAEDYGKRSEAELARQVAAFTNYDPRYLTVAFSDLRTALSEATYHSCMQTILRPKSDDDFPSVVKTLVAIPFNAFITTNIDSILETASVEALHAKQRKSPLRPIIDGQHVAQEVAANRRDWIWKIHGTIDLPKSWIFTAEEYWQSIYGAPYAAHREIIRMIAQTKRLLFVGFGGSDLDLDQHFDHLANVFGGQNRRHILLIREMGPSKRHQLSQRNIDVFEYKGPEDHSALNDLLGELSLGKGRQSATSAVRGYKAFCEWVRSVTGTIDLRRMVADHAVGLAKRPVRVNDVFVQLRQRIRHRSLGATVHAETAASSRHSLDEAVLSGADRCILLLGSAGSGKSTWLKHIAQELLTQPSRSLPIYIQLPDILPGRLRPSTAGIPDTKAPDVFLRCVHATIARKEVDLKMLKGWVDSTSTLWLLDGFDELREQAEQEYVLRLVSLCASKWPDARFVLASRPTDILSGTQTAGYEVCEVDSLDDEDIPSLTGKWVNILLTDLQENARRAIVDGFMGSFEMDAGFRDLSRNPAMLTLMLFAYLAGDRRNYPRAATNVLDAIVKWLLEARQHGVGKETISIETAQTYYGQLAIAMLKNGVTDNLRLTKTVAAQFLSTACGNNSSLANAFIEGELTCGLLMDLSGGDIAFSTPQFRDYLAAWALAESWELNAADTWSRIRLYLLDERWKGTISLFAPCLARRNAEGATRFLNLVAKMFQRESRDVQYRVFCIVGRAAFGVRAVSGNSPQQGPWTLLKQSMASLYQETGEAGPIQVRVDAATVLGLLGDDRFADQEATWVRVPPGQAELGAQTKDATRPGFDAKALPWEEPRHLWSTSGFDVRRFPITVAEYGRFVDAGGYSHREFWTTEAWTWLNENRITRPASWYRQTEVLNAPITGVSWFESSAFCRWLTRTSGSGMVVRLPTSSEWEYIAQRTPLAKAIADHRPWDEICRDGLIGNWSGVGLWQKTPVWLFPRSNSSDGVIDLFGNVEEWCEDFWPAAALDAEKEPDIVTDAPHGCRVVRGGSAVRVSRLCRPTYFSRCRTERRYATLGFRPVRSPVHIP